MKLENLLEMSWGEVADWLEDNAYLYDITPKRQWIEIDDDKPTDQKSMYWVKFNEDTVKMCYLNVYPLLENVVYWQDMNNTDLNMEETSWIKIEKPE